MELFAAAALLWRHRLLLVAGLLLAGLLSWKAMQGETVRAGVASARVMLDTPTSQLADTAPVGADTLIGRAGVLADLAETDTLSARIAQRMHVRAQDLIVKAPYLSKPPVGTPLPTKALDAAWSASAPYVLSIEAVPDVPIIAVDASAPRVRDAARLATTAVDVLKAEAGAHAGEPGILEFVIQDVTPVHAHEITNGPRRMMGAVAGVLFFAFWCFGVMCVASGIRALRYRRAASPVAVAVAEA